MVSHIEVKTDQPHSENTYMRLANITKTFSNGSVVAVNDISIDIGKNEFVVLLGPSGCGKTTTLRCIAGLETPNTGRITIGDEDMTSFKPKDRNLAYVFQDIALFPHMSVRENIRFGLDMNSDLTKEEKNERVEEIAEMLGIGEMVNRSPNQLSGGQQQRVGLGRAMVTEPNAFLLDEPFANLDANLRDTMQTEIKRLQRRLGTTMVFVTHDQGEAMTLGDTIIVMNDGNIKQQGTPYEIYHEPRNQFVAQFIGSPSTNLIECRVAQDSDGMSVSNQLFTMRFDEQVDVPDGGTVTLGIRPEHIELSEKGIFDASVSVIEPQGEKDIVYLIENGTDVVATTPPGAINEENDSVGVAFAAADAWLFDEAGNRLL